MLAVLKNELVIVQNSDNPESEVLRTLGDNDGNVPPLQLTPGLYRVIGNQPIWRLANKRSGVFGGPAVC